MDLNTINLDYSVVEMLDERSHFLLSYNKVPFPLGHIIEVVVDERHIYREHDLIIKRLRYAREQ